MKSLHVVLLAGAAILAGCATPFRAPADVAHIELTRGDSPLVKVDKIWLERKKKGPLVVTGSVLKRLETDDTTNTHIDVTLFDSDGAVLRSTVEHFEPRQIPQIYRRPDNSYYRVVLDPLPANTARIEVRAHEGNHS